MLAAADTPVGDVLGDESLEITSAPGLPQLDVTSWPSQIFWLILTFGVLYFVLARFILPVVGRTLADRSDRIADDLDAAATMQREAEDAEVAYETSLKDARAKARNVAESTRESVDAEIAAEMATADAESDRAAMMAEERIREIRAAAMANIDKVAAETSAAIVAKLSGKPARKAPARKAKA